jgi:GTP-binding protein Era
MTRCGFAAVIGAPNAGKSTLVNALVGAKVSIVTQKVQTTRFSVRGLAVAGETQIVLVDTPGIFEPRRRLDRAMIRAAWGGAHDADAIVHLVDAEAEARVIGGQGTAADRRAIHDRQTITQGLRAAGRVAILALNKTDRVRKEQLLAIAQAVAAADVYDQTFMISATGGSGVVDLKAALAERMPQGPWLYPAGERADLPSTLLAAEITREKLYLRVHEELPYAASVETTAFESRPDGSVRIEQIIYVERDGQRGIILGKDGATLKWIGQSSRRELIGLLQRRVHLFLHVKVRPGWSEDRTFYGQVGLDFDA